MENWIVVLVAIGMLALAFAGIAIKIWAKKDGEFSGTCASNSPFLKDEGATCGVCGARPDEQCKNEDSSMPEIKPSIA